MSTQQIAEQLRNLAKQIELTPEQHCAVDAVLNGEIAATSKPDPQPFFNDPSTRVMSEGIDNLTLGKPVDPYAELKAAHAAGKEIESRLKSNPELYGWTACLEPKWSHHAEYRIKPAFQLPLPPPGMQWHRTDGWTAEMLPQGYRPLLSDEIVQKTTDEFKSGHSAFQVVDGLAGMRPYMPDFNFFRTTRPLVFTHEDKTWTWHRPGDPMPCDGGRRVYWLMVRDDARLASRCSEKAQRMRWSSSDTDNSSDIIGWRYADEPKTVDLGPEDVPRADSVTCSECNWTNVSLLNLGDLGKPRWICHGCCKRAFQKIDTLQSLVGAWEPCHKPG